MFRDLTSRSENASYQLLKISGNWNSHSKCVMDMEGCGRRGGLRPNFLCYTWNHFPVPGIGAMARLDPGKYFRQDFTGPKFDLWWVLFSINEVQAHRAVQAGCFDLLLVWAICYVMWQNVICPPTPPCSFWESNSEGQQMCPSPHDTKGCRSPSTPGFVRLLPPAVYPL